MTSPSEPVYETYPSQEVFETILAEAEMNAQTDIYRTWLEGLRGDYKLEGVALELTRQERLLLRQLSTGAIR